MSSAVQPSSSSQLFRQHRREESYRSLLVRLFVLFETTQSGRLGDERFREAREAFLIELNALLEQEGSILLAEREGHLFFNGVRARIDLAGFTALKFLVRTLRSRDLSGFLFMQGLEDHELSSFFDVFLSPAGSAGKAFCDELDRREVVHVQPVLHVGGDLASVLGELHSDVAPPGTRRRSSYFKSIFLLRHLLHGLEGSELVDSVEARDVLVELVDFLLQEDGILLALDRLEESDPELFRHGIESSVLAQEIGRELGIRGEELLRLSVCALLHDFGHASLHDDAASRLSFQMLMSGTGFSELILEAAIVAHAHENLDSLEGELAERSMLFARIVNATERFARLVIRGRVYGLDPKLVVRRLAEHGIEPELIAALQKLAERLSSGARGRKRGALDVRVV